MEPYTVQREDDFDFTSGEYEDLYRRAGATPFQHGLWLTTLYETLAPLRGARKLVVTARDGEGRLLLVLPLVRRRQGLVRLVEYADLGVNDYAAPVLDPHHPWASSDGLGRKIRAALEPFDLLRIERVLGVPGPFLTLLPGARSKAHPYSTHRIELGETVDEWYERLDPEFVRHLGRKYKRLRPKNEYRLRVITDPAEVGPMMERMRAFRADRFARRRGVDLLQQPDFYAFYCTAARLSVTEGPGRLVALELAHEPVAVSFGLTDATSDLFLLVGYDQRLTRKYSLGLLIVDQMVRDALVRGQRYFDLTVGDEPYKSDFGARPEPLSEIRLPRTPLGAAALVARDAYLRARRTVKPFVEARDRRRSEARQRQSEHPADSQRPHRSGQRRDAPQVGVPVPGPPERLPSRR